MYSNGNSFGTSNSMSLGDSKNYDVFGGDGSRLGGLYTRLLTVVQCETQK